VLEAAARQAIEDASVLHIESTSAQVNQFGGYTGHTPTSFAAWVHCLAKNAGLTADRVLVGGDHLGPFPWRNETASVALEKGRELVRDCVLAGYRKIHLDASMACADDPSGPNAQQSAERAAILCESAEHAWRQRSEESLAPVYVIGTEVPKPGGESNEAEGPEVTEAADVAATVEIFRQSFTRRGLDRAWERVIGLVVQPGVEFGDEMIFDYDPARARKLSASLPVSPELVYEAHSTDYQMAAALALLVRDHFAILKVGPWLTFAYREAIFALSAVERELLSHQKGTSLSRVREALDDAMVRNPGYWRAYYQGDEDRLRRARAFSLSDRCRYYWTDPSVQQELVRLYENLGATRLPLSLISQYIPGSYAEARTGKVVPGATELIRAHIQAILRAYSSACGQADLSD
jgi:D-tagatose-1,6-bisphosphate aldolase subunit GatZ/KbaZ